MILSELTEAFERRYSLKGYARVGDFFLMESWWPVVAICICYFFVVNIFSGWMKNRTQFEIRQLMIAYNCALVLLSTYIFGSLLFYGMHSGFNLSCWPMSEKRDEASDGMAFVFWLYFFSKIVEFLDTMFFIARRKFNLVSVLHVYHHMSMPALSWLAVKYGPGGSMTITFLLNSFVHIFMYSYYALAALGPQYQKYLWWKKYVTVMQMTQFVIMIVHAIHVISIDCTYPKVLMWITLVNASIFLILFADYFFVPSKSKAKEKKRE